MNQKQISLYDRILKASNREYNIGLEKARVRDLSGAITYLKRALRLNKNHTDARNLLGLIYYEMGDFVEALSQWVISKNLNPKRNRVDIYLDDIQSNQGRMDAMNQNIKKFNQSLSYAKKGSGDLAIMQLKKVMDTNRNFIKGYQLLALLYVNKEEYDKAKKMLYHILRIDKNNELATRYMEEVKVGLKSSGRAMRKRKLRSTEMVNDDVIVPPTYRENNGWQSILQILFGLVLGAAVIFFLVMPANSAALNEENRKLIVDYNEKLAAKNNEIAQLEAEISNLESAKGDVESNLSNYTDLNTGVIAEYNGLISALSLYMGDRKAEAVERFLEIEPAPVTDEVFVSVYGGFKAMMEAEGWQIMYQSGTTAFEKRDYETARDYYLKCLTLRPNYEDAMYWLGYSFENLEDKETADVYYTQAIETKPNSPAGKSAKERRGY